MTAAQYEVRAPELPAAADVWDGPRRTGLPGQPFAVLVRVSPERAVWALLLAATAALYVWNLDVSGFANQYYSAAAQAGSESWKALFFGSLDGGNSITVDKPPLSLWPMALSVRLFGLSSWSVLIPQAVEGVASVAVLHATVKRSTGSAGAALLAGAVFASTPIAALMFRYNNPDALLTLLLVASAYATLRSLESKHAARWLMLAGALVGSAFMDKLLQAFMVVPSLLITYAFFASAPWGRRVVHLLGAFGALTVAAGWWVLTVELWPAGSRPFVGGSTHNSVLELALGYNGIGRLTGNEAGGSGLGSGWHGTNIPRMLGVSVATGVMWLMPAALLLGVGALWVSRGDHRARGPRAALTLWLTWLTVNTLVFALMAGIFHSYYTVVLAPAVGALVGVGGMLLWRARRPSVAPRVLSVASAATTVTALSVEAAHPGHLTFLLPVTLVLGVASMSVAVVDVVPRRARRAIAAVAVAAALVAPTAYSVATATTPHAGSNPLAGPGLAQRNIRLPAGLVDRLRHDDRHYRWVAAVGGARSAASLQLAAGHPVIGIGGYKGTDPSPTLAQFIRLSDDRQVHWFLDAGLTAPTFDAVAGWVRARFPSTSVGGYRLYDLTAPL